VWAEYWYFLSQRTVFSLNYASTLSTTKHQSKSPVFLSCSAFPD
jgi:hypothetical protein